MRFTEIKNLKNFGEEKNQVIFWKREKMEINSGNRSKKKKIKLNFHQCCCIDSKTELFYLIWKQKYSYFCLHFFQIIVGRCFQQESKQMLVN